MRGSVLLLLFLLVATPAAADWKRLGETPEAVVWIDPQDVRKEGDLRAVPVLHDFKAARKDGAASRLTMDQYDCKRQMVRSLTYSLHAQPRARGKVLGTGDLSPKWEPLERGMPQFVVFQTVC